MQQFVFDPRGFSREFHARKCTLVHSMRSQPRLPRQLASQVR